MNTREMKNFLLGAVLNIVDKKQFPNPKRTDSGKR